MRRGTFLILYFFLWSCTKAPQQKNVFRVALESEPSTLDPRFTTDANGQRIEQLLFNSLVRIGPNLEPVSDAAETWSYDKLTYTFHLRKGLTFSNGRLLNKDDVLFSFEQYRSETSPFRSSFQVINSVSVDDSSGILAIKINLKEFNASFPNDLPLIKLLPKPEILSGAPNFARNPIGTGSFKFESWKDQIIRLSARRQSSIEAPNIDGAEFHFIVDDNTRFLKVMTGDIDLAASALPDSKIAEVKKNDKLTVTTLPSQSMNYIVLNLKDPALEKLSVRQALNFAINREEIIRYKFGGLAQPATSLLPPGNPYRNDQLIPTLSNPERAHQLIELQKLVGKELTLKCSNSPDSIEVAKVLIRQIEKSGLKVNLQSYEWGTYFDDIQKGRFQMAMMKWVGVIDPNLYEMAFHSREKPPGRNRGSYANPLLDKLLDRAPTIVEELERVKVYRQIQNIVFEDLPIIPLWYNTQDIVLSKRVRDFTPTPMGDFQSLIRVRLD